jgi:hypothetical protein
MRIGEKVILFPLFGRKWVSINNTKAVFRPNQKTEFVRTLNT